MQYPSINLTEISLPQKFFIQKSLELLDRNTMDSYRVRVRNPRTILEELKVTIGAFERGQIKHFVAIAGKGEGQYALKDEAEMLLKIIPNYLRFDSFSAEYFTTLLKELKEQNYKQVKNCLAVLLRENVDYLGAVIAGVEAQVQEVPASAAEMLELFKRIDQTLDILYSELLDQGFSKAYLYRYFAGVFVNTPTGTFEECFATFKDRIGQMPRGYTIIFRLDTGKKIQVALTSPYPHMEFVDELPPHNEETYPKIPAKQYNKFSKPGNGQKFIKLSLSASDYRAALKKAKSALAEQLDIINLGFSDAFLRVHGQALVIDEAQPDEANFQQTVNFLDGRYRAAALLYQQFLERLPTLLARHDINTETKEKIKSAVRYLRLGNESPEVEHKFINYWIGLEYLFSSYESSDTIGRVKEYFVASHALIYVKRNLYNFYKDLQATPNAIHRQLAHFTADRNQCLQNPDLYTEVTAHLINEYPILAYRAWRLSKRIPTGNDKKKKELEEYISKHQKNLLIHFTRIYRLRNEIIHDAATDTINDQIAANLRYYLTFILNGAIDYLWQYQGEDARIEDFFTMNEIYLGNIRQRGWLLADLLAVNSSIDFMY